jgi:Zn-dependent metalloprotease
MIPTHVYEEIAKRGTPEQREHARKQIRIGEALRFKRAMLQNSGAVEGLERTPGVRTRKTYDAQGTETQPAMWTRGESDPPADDIEVNEAHDSAGETYDLLKSMTGRDSLDDQGMVLDSVVDWDRLDNAYWDGTKMTYGRGHIFERFTADPTVNGHEIGHGFQQFVWGAPYAYEPGALLEHTADVIGSLVEQAMKLHRVDEADWLIGAELMSSILKSGGSRALRDMLHPGTAYNDPLIGEDPQPDHYSRRYNGNSDNGGVHINSGIGNKAYATAARMLGGYAWEHVGLLWVKHVIIDCPPMITYPQFAVRCYALALEHFTSDIADAVKAGWLAVGLDVDASEPPQQQNPSDCPPEIREALVRLSAHPDARKVLAWGRVLAKAR